MTTKQVELYNLVTKLLLCLTQLIYVAFLFIFISMFPLQSYSHYTILLRLFIVFVQVSLFIFSPSILKRLFVVISGDTPFYADSLVGTYGECMHCYLFKTSMLCVKQLWLELILIELKFTYNGSMIIQ